MEAHLFSEAMPTGKRRGHRQFLVKDQVQGIITPDNVYDDMTLKPADTIMNAGGSTQYRRILRSDAAST